MDTFLTSQNLNSNYQFVVNRVRQDTGVDLSKYGGMEKQFQKMATLIANKEAAISNNTSLSHLNNKLINDAASFFAGQINKKRQSPPKSGMQTEDLSTQYNDNLGFSTLKKNDDVGGAFANLVASRQAQEQKPVKYDMPVSQSARDIAKQDNGDLTKALQNVLLERGQVNETSGLMGQVPKVLPFNLNDDVTNMLSSEPGIDLPLYQNVIDLESNNNATTDELMNRVSELEKGRLAESESIDTGIINFNNLDRDAKSRAIAKMTARKGESNMQQERNNTDAQTLFESVAKDPVELYKMSSEGTQRMINRMTEGGISGNDTRSINPLADNILVEKLLSLQRELQPKYRERVNYIIVNSIDRDWFNNPNESRYNFKVNFKPNSSHRGAGILDLYRNVTSVELVNAILPQDCVNIPFDSRVYIDILNFPYLLLQIPEFSDVFRGTNSHNDRAFSVLIFDKQHDSSVLSADFISGSNSIVNTTPTTQFYREYRKTFYKYTPAYFEKKVYDNMPLASLGHMTLILNTPAGENLNTLDDVLSIYDVQPSTVLGSIANTLEYDSSTSYPNDSGFANRQYIRIQTNTCFSSKLFRLGDLIKIEGYGTTGVKTYNTAFTNFINREEGHYILNLDQANITNSNANANQGYISNIYIAPPGDLTSNLCLLDGSSYYMSTANINFENYTDSAKLINTALQTHYLFKITTREGDVKNVILPMNV